MDRPPDDPAAWRRARRSELLAARHALSPEEQERASRSVLDLLGRHFAWLGSKRLGFYWPTRDEIDVRPFVEKLGGEAALPVVTARNAPLDFRAWHAGAAMAPGDYGIPIPAAGEAILPDALLVPLLGYDEAGFRLGYGGGYYDRTLAAMASVPVTIGIGFSLGRLETIHPAPHDRPMDFIVTEAGALRRGSGALLPL